MSPRGQEHGMSRETGAVNNKIYYPSGISVRGTAVCWNLQSGIEGEKLGGIPKRIEEGRCDAVACQHPPVRRLGIEREEVGKL